MKEEIIIEAVKELYIQEYGNLSESFDTDGYFIIGFVRAALNSINKANNKV